MRKRSEVKVAPAVDPPLPGQTAMFLSCPSCALKQSAGMVRENEGKCVKCGADMQPATAPTAQPAAKEPDPWGLKPGSVVSSTKDGVTVGSMSATNAGGAMAPSAECDFATLRARLMSGGGVDISIVAIAGLTPEQREMARKWIVGNWVAIERPQFLDPYLVKPESKGSAPTATTPTKTKEEKLAANSEYGQRVASTWDPAGVTQGDEVEYVWAEEKLTPIQGVFSSVSVGPFSTKTRIRPGEAYGDAYIRLATQTNEMAEIERTRKVNSFIKALRGAMNEAVK